MAIVSFEDREAERFFVEGRLPKRCSWKPIAKIVQRKLDMLDFARELRDLKVPPSNRLELLRGHLRGYYSIRINDQWRIIFLWEEGPCEVAIVDYH